MPDAIRIDTIEQAKAIREFDIALRPDGVHVAAQQPGRVPPETRIGLMLTHVAVPVSDALQLREDMIDAADALAGVSDCGSLAMLLRQGAERVLPAVFVDRQAAWSDSGVGYCVVHDGVVEVDADLCDRVEDDDHPGPDGEPRSCDIRPMFYPAAPQPLNS